MRTIREGIIVGAVGSHLDYEKPTKVRVILVGSDPDNGRLFQVRQVDMTPSEARSLASGLNDAALEIDP